MTWSEESIVMPVMSPCCCWSDVYLTVCIHAYIPVSLVCTSMGSHPAPANPPQSSSTLLSIKDLTNWLTSDLRSLNKVLIGSLAACGLSHTNTLSTCVWFCDWSLKDFFVLVFILALCTAWMIQDIAPQSSRNDSKEMTIIFTSFSLVFQMQKKSASVFQLSHNTLFLYANGAKICMWMWLGHNWNNAIHPMDHLDLRFNTPGTQMGWTTSMHAPIIYRTPSDSSKYLLLNHFKLSIPFQHSIIPNFCLCICYMTCIYFCKNLHTVKGRCIIGYKWIKQTNIFVWL